MKYIAYYRVSTKEQGRSGLGIEAQKRAVSNYLKENKIFASYTDIESGKNNNRIELNKALEVCKSDKDNFTLVIAKIDRLSRNLTFISSLMDAKINFVACDMPTANNFTIHIFAALAQQEREMISKRTEDSLKSIKKDIETNGFHISKQGNKITALGNSKNLTSSARAKGVQNNIENSKANENNKKAFELIKLLKDANMNYNKIAKKLNESGFKTAKGKEFQAVQVQRIYNKYTA